MEVSRQAAGAVGGTIRPMTPNAWFGVRRAGLLVAALALSGWAGPAAAATATTELVVATVNNAHMLQMQQLSRHFEAQNPDLRLKWVTLEEGQLRQRVTADIARRGGEFDVTTIGMLEAPVWGRQGWLMPLQLPASYDVDDLLPNIRAGLSHGGRLYAAPFYGESSMLMLRTDLLAQAGLALPVRPTWVQVATLAARLHRPEQGVYGICLRGKPGWGENITLLSTMVNAFGGQWFNMAWQPQLDSKPWRDATTLYADLLRRYGPPGPTTNGYNELLALFMAGRCAMWVDATVAASSVSDPRVSQVAQRVAFLPAPGQVTTKGSHWLWAWALAIPAGSRHAEAAQRFVAWATSRDYIRLAAAEAGWARVPTGTRRSTYATPEFQAAAAFATAEKLAIDSANPNDSTLARSPYVGVQFATIAEFQSIGSAVGQQVSAVVAGRSSVEAALKAAQDITEREMRRAGYLH